MGEMLALVKLERWSSEHKLWKITIPPHSHVCQDFREAVGAAVGDEGEPVLDDERLREILNELPDVYTLHRRILNELENRIRHWWDPMDHPMLLILHVHMLLLKRNGLPRSYSFFQRVHTLKPLRKHYMQPKDWCMRLLLYPLTYSMFLHSGRRARGLETSSCPEKRNSWFLPLILATTTEAWACWRTAAGLHPPSQLLFTSLRSDLQCFSISKLKTTSDKIWHVKPSQSSNLNVKLYTHMPQYE